DEENSRLVTELAQTGEVGLVGHDDAALALDRLHEHRRGVAVDGALQSLEVVVGDVLEAAGERLAAVVVLLLGGGGAGGHAAPVEAAAHADDVTTVARPVL